MRFQLEIDINAPRERVAELFVDASQLAKWQPDLVSADQIRGEGRQPGAATKQVHNMGGSRVESIETIMIADGVPLCSAL